MPTLRQSIITTAAVAAIALTTAACGSKAATPTTDIPTVRGTSVTITLDPQLASTLASMQIVPTASGDVQLSRTALTIPISSGHFAIYRTEDASPPVQGELRQQNGGLTFTHGSTAVKLTNLRVELTTNPELVADAQVGSGQVQQDVDVVEFDGKNLRAAPSNQSSTYTLADLPAYVSTDGATLFNQAFNTTQLKGGLNTGLKLGTGTIVVSSQ